MKRAFSCAIFLAIILFLFRGQDFAKPQWMQLALAEDQGAPIAEPFKWSTRAPGLETTVISVRYQKVEVDRVFLVRMSPEKYRIRVRYNQINPKRVEQWRRDTKAVAVINGSYYQETMTPSTPIKSGNQWFGPKGYSSSHGALVIGDTVSILDLAGKSTDEELANYPDAMVSFPLLIDGQGKVRAKGKSHWLANRSFVGITKDGRIIFGATERGFFSLRRLGVFLQSLPLEFDAVLNLDGGPVTSLMVQSGNYQKIVRGTWAINDNTTLPDLVLQRTRWDSQWWRLPIVLTAEPSRP